MCCIVFAFAFDSMSKPCVRSHPGELRPNVGNWRPKNNEVNACRNKIGVGDVERGVDQLPRRPDVAESVKCCR